jgi:transposase-like protein
MDETLASAVLKVRAHAARPGVNVEQIAVQIGVATATLYRLLRGGSEDVRYSTARAVIDFANSLPDTHLMGTEPTASPSA